VAGGKAVHRGLILGVVVVSGAVLAAVVAFDPKDLWHRLTGRSGADSRPAADATGFYRATEPTTNARGSVLRSELLDPGDDLPDGTRLLRIAYETLDARDQPVVASAAVAIPPNAADAPIAVWGHGAVGTAPGCGPSRRGFAAPYAASLLADGVIVVAPDFTGLGMEGVPYPYLHGTSAGRSVLDAARAARNVEPAASNRVALYGTSAGGHAVLWANQLAVGEDGSGLDVRAVVAVAPIASLPTAMAHFSVTPGLAPYAVQLAATWPSVVPGLDPGAVLTPAALARQDVLGSSCLAQLMDHFGGPPSQWLGRDGFLDPTWATQLAEQSPGSSAGAAEVLLFQGERDTSVLPAWTTQLASDLEAGGTATTLVTNRNADHVGMVAASQVQAVEAMLARLRTSS